MPWCSISSKDKSFPALYLSFHQYRRTQCKAKPHFLLYAGYLHSAMWRVSSVMNSPEVIRKMLLLSGKNKTMKKWWWINRKRRQIRKRWSRNGTSWLRNRCLGRIVGTLCCLAGGCCQFINQEASRCLQQHSKHYLPHHSQRACEGDDGVFVCCICVRFKQVWISLKESGCLSASLAVPNSVSSKK